jgi:hypothetical protein
MVGPGALPGCFLRAPSPSRDLASEPGKFAMFIMRSMYNAKRREDPACSTRNFDRIRIWPSLPERTAVSNRPISTTSRAVRGYLAALSCAGTVLDPATITELCAYSRCSLESLYSAAVKIRHEAKHIAQFQRLLGCCERQM